MARPKLAPDKRLSERVGINLTQSELLRGADRADRAGLTLAEYARKQFVSGRVVVKQYRQLDHAIIDQIRRIGVNLNQLMPIAHRDKKLPPTLPRLINLIEQFLTEQIDEPRRK